MPGRCQRNWWLLHTKQYISAFRADCSKALFLLNDVRSDLRAPSSVSNFATFAAIRLASSLLSSLVRRTSVYE